MLLGLPGQGEGSSLPPEACRGYSCQDWQEGHGGRLQASGYNTESVVSGYVHLFCMWASAPDWGAVFCCREDEGLGGQSQCLSRGSPGCSSKAADQCDPGCHLGCDIFEVFKRQRTIQTHAKVFGSLLNLQAFAVDSDLDFPPCFSVAEMVCCCDCLSDAEL